MITLQNKGLLELDFIKIMGCHVKESDDCFGIFGTGLKYAIAVFLRDNIKVKLFIGNNEFDFFTEPKTIRSKEFNMCYMRGPQDSTPLGFTTELGKNWGLWQAYREIHSNCLDEKKGIIENNKTLSPKENFTTFHINIDPEEVKDVFLNLEEEEILYEDDTLQILKGESDYIYYQGIRAKDLSSPSKYTYNILSKCNLTEDRLLCYDFQIKEKINRAVVKLAETRADIMETIITSTSDNFESDLSMEYNCSIAPSDTFKKAVEGVKELNIPINDSVENYIVKHTPPKELTKEEKLKNFIDDLYELCEENEVTIDRQDTLSSISFEVYGGLLDEDT